MVDQLLMDPGRSVRLARTLIGRLDMDEQRGIALLATGRGPRAPVVVPTPRDPEHAAQAPEVRRRGCHVGALVVAGRWPQAAPEREVARSSRAGPTLEHEAPPFLNEWRASWVTGPGKGAVAVVVPKSGLLPFLERPSAALDGVGP